MIELWEEEFISTVYVILECNNDKFPENELEDIIDYEFDDLNRDIVTFNCPKCGKLHRSFRLG